MGYKQIVWQMKDKRKTNAAIEVDTESKVIEKGVEWENKVLAMLVTTCPEGAMTRGNKKLF